MDSESRPKNDEKGSKMDNQVKKVVKLQPYTLVLGTDNTYHICKTSKHLKGEGPKGISFYRGSFADCLLKIMNW